MGVDLPFYETPSKDMSLVDHLNIKCEEALSFPNSLIRHNTYPYSIDTQLKRLNEHEYRLFNNEEEAAVDFSEFAIDGISMR